MAYLRAEMGGFETTASNIEESGAAVVKQLEAIRTKIVDGSRSFFIAQRGDNLRSKTDTVFSEAKNDIQKFYQSLAEGIRIERDNIARMDTV